MNGRAPGFTLVEFLVVAVLVIIILTGVYKLVVYQDQSGRQARVVTATQQTIRTTMQILQAELREVSTSGGDILMASSDSVRIQTLRKSGFVCGPATTNKLDVWTMGDRFATNDTILVFSDGPSATSMTDDVWRETFVTDTGTTSCANAVWPNSTVQRIGVYDDGVRANVRSGAPIRSIERLVYGNFMINGNWYLGRRVGDLATLEPIIGPLASPANRGLVLQYYDTLNALIPGANLTTAAGRRAIRRMRITIVGATPGAARPRNGSYVDSLTSDVYFRGN
ncbi:MAG TPA: type II secretion system protein [Longimicrobiales bacterium]|nr:type II secretion system protein [Longimicrobiales bacterium]